MKLEIVQKIYSDLTNRNPKIKKLLSQSIVTSLIVMMNCKKYGKKLKPPRVKLHLNSGKKHTLHSLMITNFANGK